MDEIEWTEGRRGGGRNRVEGGNKVDGGGGEGCRVHELGFAP